jgi:hypothetical protein
MQRQPEKRRHRRVRYSWPLFFGYEETGQMFRGQVFDVSRSGASFTLNQNDCPPLGHTVLTRFSYPHDATNMFDMDSYFYWATVVRCDDIGYGKRKVSLELHRHLESDPIGEPAFTGMPSMALA